MNLRQVSLRQFLREPLAHFVLIGLALFLLHGWVAPADEAGRRIVVNQARVDDMAREYRAQLGRSPAPEELKSLVDTYVHDEILYREGMAQGLGRDDPVIRRRILQKYEIILEEESGQGAPSDADLSAYLKAHPAEFERPATVTFDQVFFDASGSPAEGEQRFEAARRAALRGADPAGLGQDSMLPRHVETTPLDRVAQDFGPAFAAGLAEAPVGRWIGPLPSSYGAHLVRVAARTPPSLPPLDEVRAAVAREWEGDRRRRALAATYDKLRGDYDVAVKARLSQQLAAR
jgi:hypothetical protein